MQTSWYYLHHPLSNPSCLLCTHDRASPPSAHNPLDKALLQPPHLPLKSLHLPPTIQRPPIINPQTLHHLLLRLLHSRIRIHLLPNLPLPQCPLQRLNLLHHALPAQIPPFIPLLLSLMIHSSGGLGLVRHGCGGGMSGLGASVGGV